MAELDFDTNNHEPLGNFAPLPAGDYLAVIGNSEKKETNKKNGHYLQLTWEVLNDGDNKGRLVWTRLNLWNDNADAVRIAGKELRSICDAVGVSGKLRDSTELHGKLAVISVICEPRNDKPGEFSNRIKGYAPAATQQTQQKPAGNKPPWKK